MLQLPLAMSQIYGRIFNEEGLSLTHLKIVELVGKVKEVLELGSSIGYLTKQMVLNNCQVDIVEVDEEDARAAKRFARKAYVGSLEEINTIERIDDTYDVIVASNILEHLKNPDETLQLIKEKLKKDGKILVALPNIACWAIRKDLFFRGKFNYQETGILDKTHLRFYTYYTAQSLVKQNGLKIVDIIPTEISYPLRFKVLKLGYPGLFIDRVVSSNLVKFFPNLIVSHFIMVAVRK